MLFLILLMSLIYILVFCKLGSKAAVSLWKVVLPNLKTKITQKYMYACYV